MSLDHRFSRAGLVPQPCGKHTRICICIGSSLDFLVLYVSILRDFHPIFLFAWEFGITPRRFSFSRAGYQATFAPDARQIFFDCDPTHACKLAKQVRNASSIIIPSPDFIIQQTTIHQGGNLTWWVRDE